MAGVSTYLNFADTTEAAFAFYKSVFGTDYSAPVMRFQDIPASPEVPPMTAEVANLVMHMQLPILGGHVLHGSDAPEVFGFKVAKGNNVHINLEPDTREECERLFAALSEDGEVEMPLQDQFWGGYFASFTDRFGIRWMVNGPAKT